jgi:Na+/H+ antiporter NhaD/arsenite permease-like protein
VKKSALLLLLIFVFFQCGTVDVFAFESRIVPVNPAMTLPFILLLLAIALSPFVGSEWWGRNYPFVALGLAAVSIVYYLFVIHNGMRMAGTALEYFSFICLIGSLFVVSGGIHIRVGGRSTPAANVVMLAIGAVLANILGTTGASMVLIRPFLKANKYRISGYHIVFFIFIVSNIGGLLTPIGDPPLFLGYLKGVPFFWCLGNLWQIWLITTSIVLLIFYVIDRHNYSKLPDAMEKEIEAEGEHAFLQGAHNLGFLLAIIFSVSLAEPLREIIMVACAAGSYYTTKEEVHRRNAFNFIPIKEVAVLFAGIFATMVPALDWLELNAGRLGITEPAHFYWMAGALSSVLDNAPAYLNFLSAAFGLHGLSVDNSIHMQAMLCTLPAAEAGQIQTTAQAARLISADSWKYVQAISAGAVMFGACTYIGNGPNFMVKSIAEQADVKVPGFIGYIVKYTIPILLPVYAIIWLIFFK